ncbi:MAG: amidohydrolase family protein [Candidatus Thermoplasmatota archaeon]|nr:amidohydrolase family protein [Candidatus Thermoplasmatota archaeon]
MELSGLVYDPKSPDRFIHGYVAVENGKIVDVGEGDDVKGLRGIILPSMVDAHTHLADGGLFRSLPTDLEETFTPPNGLKHKHLANSSRKQKVQAFKNGMETLQAEGVGLVCDFREEGVAGIGMGAEATKGLTAKPVLLGRPDGCTPEKILDAGDGIGLPSILGVEEAAEMSALCKARKKLFSFHHSENAREELEPVLDLKPDFVVHCTHCTPGEMERLAQAKIGAVICPSANALYGAIPEMRSMLDSGLVLGLGTDNAMTRTPSILESLTEACMLSRLAKSPISPQEALDMAVLGGRKVLKHMGGIIRKGERADLMLCRLPEGCEASNAANYMVTRARRWDVLQMVR